MDITEFKDQNFQRHPWELARFDILSGMIDNFLPAKGTKIIVDIGCGDAFFAKELLNKRNDIEIVGVDTAYSAKEITGKLTEINNPRFRLFASIEEAKDYLGATPVNFILLLDVIEHIENDIQFLKDIATAPFVAAETKILITVPAFQSLFTEHDVFLNHYRRYYLKSLKRTICEGGFIPMQTGYFFLTLLSLRLFEKIKEKIGFKPHAKGIGQWEQATFVTLFLRKCLLFDYKISKLFLKAGIHLPGLSAYCICKK